MFTKKDNMKNEVKNSKNGKNTSSSHQTHDPYSEDDSGCCQPLTKAPNQQPAKTYPQQQSTKQHDLHMDKKPLAKTRVTIKYDAGFPNQLYIRGKGANLSWDKGQPLKNIKPDEWIWETDTHFTHCEFKILINDRVYENGENHLLNAGSSLVYTPHFY
jgi:hypothetical protein